MQVTRIYLGKNNKKEKPTQPDLILYAITDDDVFVPVASLWKAKSGNGYTGAIKDTATLNTIVQTGEKKDVFEELTGQPSAQEKAEGIDISKTPF